MQEEHDFFCSDVMQCIIGFSLFSHDPDGGLQKHGIVVQQLQTYNSVILGWGSENIIALMLVQWFGVQFNFRYQGKTEE